MSIAPDVKLGQDVMVLQPALVDLSGCTIGDQAKIRAFGEIQKNATIGKHALVDAGAVMTHDVPAYAILAGVPAHVIRAARERKGGTP